MSEEDYTFCMIPDLRNNSNDFSIVDQLSIVTFSRISSLLLLLFARSKRSKHSVCLSHDDFLILLALFWCQISPSLKVAIVSKKKSVVLTFWRRPVCIACWKIVYRWEVAYACSAERGCKSFTIYDLTCPSYLFVFCSHGATDSLLVSFNQLPW